MDENVGGLLSGIPPSALTLTLTRSVIRMEHSHSWRADKVNQVHDLVVCLEGRGRYVIGEEEIEMSPGRAMLIRRGERFVGWNPDSDMYIGVAQHFTLDLFNRHDLIAQMQLKPVVDLSRWNVIGPLVRFYRETSPPSSTTLMQFHLFMFILLDFLEDAFVAWSSNPTAGLSAPEGLPLAIMLAATQISANPLDEGIVDRVMSQTPYNADYFQREFRQRIGWTPLKFREFKRMERAMHLLQAGRSVSETAAEVGYGDVYYFSRMFKRHIGTSPRGYQLAVQRCRDGVFPRGEEDGEVHYPLLPQRIDQLEMAGFPFSRSARMASPE